jgi:hypothetical protein
VIDLAPRARAGELSHESVIEQPLRQALRSRTKDDSGRRIAQLEAEVGSPDRGPRRRDDVACPPSAAAGGRGRAEAPEVSPEAGVGRDLVAASAGPDPSPRPRPRATGRARARPRPGGGSAGA